MLPTTPPDVHVPADAWFNRPAALSLYQALITQDPFYLTLEQTAGPDPEAARQAMVRYMDYAMKEARDHGDLRLTPDRSSGAAVWSIPLVPDRAAALAARKKAFISDRLGQTALETYCTIVDFMAAQSREVVPASAWYLSILGVDPNAQGQGLGGALVRPVLESTDALGMPAYIESFTPANFGFYEHLGFTTVKTVSEPVTGSDYAIMVRRPQ